MANGGVLGAIANPQSGNVLGGIMQGQQFLQGAQALQQGQAKLGQQKKANQVEQLRGEILGSTFEGKLADLTKLSPEAGLKVADALGIPIDEPGRIKNMMGTAQVVSTLMRKGLVPEAKDILLKKKEMLNGLQIATPKIDEQLALIDTNPEEVAANASALTQAGIEAGILTDPSKPSKEQTQKRVDVLRTTVDKFGKEFKTVEDSFARIQAVALKPSAAGDLALIFNFMKMLDPGSTVRETEFANAQNAAGVPEIVRAQWARLKNGERLGEVQRADFLGQTEALFAAQQQVNDDRIQEVLDRGIQDQVDGVRILGETKLNAFNERRQAREAPQVQGFGSGNKSAADLTTADLATLSTEEKQRLREVLTAGEGG